MKLGEKLIKAILWLMWGLFAWGRTFLSEVSLKIKSLVRLNVVLPKDKLHLIKGRYSDKVNIFLQSSRSWAINKENPAIREERKRWLARAEINQTISSHSASQVYETLRLYILTGKWETEIKHIYFVLAYFAIINSIFMPFILIFLVNEPIPLPSRTPGNFLSTEIFIGFIAIISLLTGIFVFLSIIRQLREWAPRLWLSFVVLVSFIYWSFEALSRTSEVQLSNSTYLILGMLCLAAITSTTSFFAYALQWRLVYGFKPINHWAHLLASGTLKHEMISRISAWIIFMAPHKEGKLGWQTPPEIDLLARTGALEREGAEWRAIIFGILALVGFNSIGDLSVFLGSLSVNIGQLPEGSIIRIIFQLLLIHPVFILGFLWIFIIGWAILMEIWLTELPNQIISSACIQLQHTFIESDNQIDRSYENYRVITTNNPDSITKGFHRWNLIDKRQLEDGKWCCLVEAQKWIGLHDES